MENLGPSTTEIVSGIGRLNPVMKRASGTRVEEQSTQRFRKTHVPARKGNVWLGIDLASFTRVGFYHAASWVALHPTFKPRVICVLCYEPHILSCNARPVVRHPTRDAVASGRSVTSDLWFADARPGGMYFPTRTCCQYDPQSSSSTRSAQDIVYHLLSPHSCGAERLGIPINIISLCKTPFARIATSGHGS